MGLELLRVSRGKVIEYLFCVSFMMRLFFEFIFIIEVGRVFIFN